MISHLYPKVPFRPEASYRLANTRVTLVWSTRFCKYSRANLIPTLNKQTSLAFEEVRLRVDRDRPIFISKQPTYLKVGTFVLPDSKMWNDLRCAISSRVCKNPLKSSNWTLTSQKVKKNKVLMWTRTPLRLHHGWIHGYFLLVTFDGFYWNVSITFNYLMHFVLFFRSTCAS